MHAADWTVQGELFLHGKCVFVLASSALLQSILKLAHTNSHEGIQKTLHPLRSDFVIDTDRAVVRDFVKAFFF